MEKRKLKLSFICPTKFINTYQSQGDFVLALAHLLSLEEENEYEKAIKATKLPIILDNSLFENHVPEPIETLIEKAIKIGATHFFAPDVLFDSLRTQQQLDKAVEVLAAKKQSKQYFLEKDLKIAAVVQADNVDDYMCQLVDFNNNPNVDLIGLSILSIPKSFEQQLGHFDIAQSRSTLMQKMWDLTELGGIQWKSMHLLGLGDSLTDVIYAKTYCPFVVSHDSSSAFWNAMRGKQILSSGDVEGGKTDVAVDFEFNSATTEQLALAQQNIDTYKKLLQ